MRLRLKLFGSIAATLIAFCVGPGTAHGQSCKTITLTDLSSNYSPAYFTVSVWSSDGVSQYFADIAFPLPVGQSQTFDLSTLNNFPAGQYMLNVRDATAPPFYAPPGVASFQVTLGSAFEFSNGSSTVTGTSNQGVNNGYVSYSITVAAGCSCLPAKPTLSYGFPGIQNWEAYMTANFRPLNSEKITAYATRCGFDQLAWEQEITNLPKPTGTKSAKIPKDPNSLPYNVQSLLPNPPLGACSENWLANECILFATPDHPFSDPPPGGYVGDSALIDSSPFYYPLAWTQASDFCTSAHMPVCPSPFPFILNSALTPLWFVDDPANNTLPAGTFMEFKTSLIGVSATTGAPCGDPGKHYCTTLYSWTWKTNFDGQVCSGFLNFFGVCSTGEVSQLDAVYPVIPSSGTGEVTITSINGVQLPPSVPSTEITVTASGLAYSRVTKTFNGTLTLKNISHNVIDGPLQILFTGVSTSVTMVNATNNLSGTPYLTIPNVTSLAPGQSATVDIQFNNPSSATINVTPAIYSGTIN